MASLNFVSMTQGSGISSISISSTNITTLQAGAPATILSLNLTLLQDALLDTSGNTMTLNGSTSGSGGWLVSGSGVVVLGTSNSYTGNTRVAAGSMLVLMDPDSLMGSTFDSSGGGDARGFRLTLSPTSAA